MNAYLNDDKTRLTTCWEVNNTFDVMFLASHFIRVNVRNSETEESVVEGKLSVRKVVCKSFLIPPSRPMLLNSGVVPE